MQGKKTHEQQLRILERKSDVPDARQTESSLNSSGRNERAHIARKNVRQSEMPISRGGMNQESDHNKHNDPGQSHHKPQKYSHEQEKP